MKKYKTNIILINLRTLGRLLDELLVREVSLLSMESGRWKTGSGAITTSGSFNM